MATKPSKLAAYLAATATRAPEEPRKADAPAEAPAPSAVGPVPKNPACGCSYCRGNALVVPMNHKPRGNARPAPAPSAVFAPTPNCAVGIALAYSVTGFETRAITDPLGDGPMAARETLEVPGWLMPSPTMPC